MNPMSRREMLAGALGALACGTSVRGARAGDAAATLPALASHPTIGPVSAAAKSTVVHIQADDVMTGSRVHPSLAGEMVEEALRLLTRHQRPADAWHAYLKPDDVIGIKFNHVGEDVINTTVPFAAQLVDSLKRAGFAPDRIVLIEAPAEAQRNLRTRRPPSGWSGPEVDFDSGREQLSAVLQDVTAIINVPFLKTHNIAGMTGCLKNLSHALIRRPARYHGNGCAPYVGDILALPQIRSKLRLHIMNALQIVFADGPAARLDTLWQHRGVIVSADPVAADTVALDVLNAQRARAKLPAIGNSLGQIPHVHGAAENGLGTDDQDYITLLESRPF